MKLVKLAFLCTAVGCAVGVGCGDTAGVEFGALERADSGQSGSGQSGSSGKGGAAGSDNTGGGVSGGGGSGGDSSGSGGSAGTSSAGGSASPDAGKGGGAGAGGAPAADAGDMCRALITDYEAALAEAKRCNPAIDTVQCQATASSSLACPGCSTHVQDDSALSAIRAEWTKRGCKSGICPAIKCILPGVGRCTPTDGGGGICTGTPLLL